MTRHHLSLRAAACLIAVVATSCGGSQDNDRDSDGGDASLPSTSSMASPVTTVESPPLDGDLKRTRDEIARSFDTLREHPAVEVRHRSLELDGAAVEGTVRIDQTTGDYSSTERIRPEINPDKPVVSERRVVGSTLYARFYAATDDESEVVWSESDAGADATFIADLRSVAYTALGGAGGGLDRLVALLDDVAWRIEGAATTDVDGRTIRSVLVGFEAADVAAYLRTSGLEPAAIDEPEGQTLYEFWIDADTGELVRLLAAGVQFQDGEPLDGAAIEIDYTPIEALEIERPI